ncbi:unnamed protein product [Trifolium pratense]|uniref:Uncharacterized protein n=1 Tax=Trifolium pratense TaxID=57577 RepID=A0ACB0ME62_TRIPR|nr:unnamed protein product [Trifolium pratense]
MTTMNVYATSYHLDIHAGSSSHSQEPPSQTVNVDEFGGSYNNNRKKKNKKNIDDGRTTAYHAKNIPICNMHLSPFALSTKTEKIKEELRDDAGTKKRKN